MGGAGPPSRFLIGWEGGIGRSLAAVGGSEKPQLPRKALGVLEQPPAARERGRCSWRRLRAERGEAEAGVAGGRRGPGREAKVREAAWRGPAGPPQWEEGRRGSPSRAGGMARALARLRGRGSPRERGRPDREPAGS